jgi:DNA polymerase-3 subunit alpha
VHDDLSLLDGISKRVDIIAKCKEHGITATACTNHGNLSNHISFYQQCVDAGIKPILGMEAYLAPNSRFDKKAGPTEEVKDFSDKYSHLILLAKNADGYQNLKKLSTISYREGFYHKPRIDLEILQQYSKGLIALSACIGSITSQAILNGNKDRAREYINKFRYMFGEDFYLELMQHDMPQDKIISEALIDFSKELGIGTVLTNDSHFTNEGDAFAHEIALCINTRKTIDDTTRFKFDGTGYWYKSPAEMVALAKRSGYPDECISNTMLIANKIEDYAFKLKKFMVPKFKEGNKSYTSDESHDTLVRMCYEGLERVGKIDDMSYVERLEYELDVIKRKNFSSYFLIIADIIVYIKNHGSMLAPLGRGSSAGAMVCYTLGITAFDPIRFNIPFYRFINEGRKDLPDIDTDISRRHRGDVIKYIQNKYGADKVAQICTYQQMAAKSAIDNVGRVLNVPAVNRKAVSKMLGEDVTKDEQVEDLLREHPDARSAMSQYQGWIDNAIKLQGTFRTKSTHAAGIVIANEAVDTYSPLGRDEDEFAVTQYDMGDCALLGLLKLDMLGLRTLDVIYDTITQVKERHDVDIDIYNMNLEDASVFKLMQAANFVSVFQYDSQGMRALAKRLCPETFDHMVALNALYRPGPMEPQVRVDENGKEHKTQSICDTYIECRHGRQQPEAWHQSLSAVMERTFGMPLYQEQISEMAKIIAGFTDTEADEFRSAVGKKDAVKFQKAIDKFVDGGTKHGHTMDFMKSLAAKLVGFARYAWNISHSISYSTISYITAYLEAHYPCEYYTALLNNNDDSKIISVLMASIMQHNIQIKPPNVNDSAELYTTDGKNIYMGISSVSKLGGSATATMLVDKELNGRYSSFIDFVSRVSNPGSVSTSDSRFLRLIGSDKVVAGTTSYQLKTLNKTVIENLIKAGCFKFDDLMTDKDRINTLPDIQKYVKKHPSANELEVLNSIHESITNEEYSKIEMSENERSALNFYISDHPASIYMKYVNNFYSDRTIISPSQMSSCEVNEGVLVLGLLVNKEIKTAKTGNPYLTVKLQDQFGDLYARIWSPMCDDITPYLVDNHMAILKGIVVHDKFHGDRLDIKVQAMVSVGNSIPVSGVIVDSNQHITHVETVLNSKLTCANNVLAGSIVGMLKAPMMVSIKDFESCVAVDCKFILAI